MSEVKTNWAMPTVATLWIVASLCFGLFALLVGLVPMAGTSVLCAWLIAGSVGLFICAIIEFVRGEIVLGTVTLVFAPLVALGGGMTFTAILELAPLGPEAMAAGMALSGWVWLAIGILFFLFLPALAKVSWSLFIMMIELGVGIIMIAIGMMTGVPMGEGLMLIAGYLVIIFAVYAMYAGLVFLTNTVYQAPKLSIGGPIVK